MFLRRRKKEPAKKTAGKRNKETNFDYFGARYYDSGIGRWTIACPPELCFLIRRRVDPLASKYPGWSPYNYALNNPLKNVDPNGKWVDPFPLLTKIAIVLGIMDKEQQSFRDKATEFRKDGIFPNISDGPADAWRHVATSKFFTEKYGGLTAKILGAANEGKAVLKGFDMKGKELDKNINQI